MKIEKDRVQIKSGLRSGLTTGAPITLIIENLDWPNWSEIMDPFKPIPKNLGLKQKRLAEETTTPRPGHADLSGGIKWDHHDLRNVLERASARETAARVAVGSIARQFLESFDVEFASHVLQIGTVRLIDDIDRSSIARIRELSEESEVRCIDSGAETAMIAEIKAAKKSRDSLGGIVELIVRGLPVGLGSLSQSDSRLDARLAGALMSIQSVKGIEIGSAFESAGKLGSEVHDEIFYDPDRGGPSKGFFRKTNNAGGLEGGITNGEDIIARVAAKPISTLNRPLATVDVKTKKPAEAMVERTDNCAIPPLAVVCEAAAAFVLCDAFFAKFGSDNLSETRRNYQSFLDNRY